MNIFNISNPCNDRRCEFCNHTGPLLFCHCIHKAPTRFDLIKETGECLKKIYFDKILVASNKNETTKNILNSSSKGRKISRWC